MTKLLRAVSTLLNVLSVVARNKDEGGLADLLKTASIVVREGDEATDQLEKIALDIDAMVAAGEDPTAEQLADVAARRKELSDEVQSVDLMTEAERDALADSVLVPEDGENTEEVPEDGNEESA